MTVLFLKKVVRDLGILFILELMVSTRVSPKFHKFAHVRQFYLKRDKPRLLLNVIGCRASPIRIARALCSGSVGKRSALRLLGLYRGKKRCSRGMGGPVRSPPNPVLTLYSCVFGEKKKNRTCRFSTKSLSQPLLYFFLNILTESTFLYFC